MTFVNLGSPIVNIPQLPVGSIISSVSSSISGYRICDGTTENRVGAFANLFAVMPFITSSTITLTTGTPGIVTWNSHGLSSGQTIQFNSVGSIGGILANTVYFVSPINSNTFWLYTTKSNAINQTSAIILTGTTSNNLTAISYRFGNGNGSTTFNVPDFRSAYPRGAGTSDSFVQNRTTALGEILSDQLQGHSHDGRVTINTGTGFPDNATFAQGNGSNTGAALNNTGLLNQGYRADTVGGLTPRTGNETRPNSIGVNYFIKV